jgi:hypothetical protein
MDPLDGNRQDIIKGERVESQIEKPEISCPLSLYTELNRIIREEDEILNREML